MLIYLQYVNIMISNVDVLFIIYIIKHHGFRNVDHLQS